MPHEVPGESSVAAADAELTARLSSVLLATVSGLALVMFLFFPFIASLQFGFAFSAVGVAALGYALYQAWTQTDGQGLHLELKGPFRVGQGPIPAR